MKLLPHISIIVSTCLVRCDDRKIELYNGTEIAKVIYRVSSKHCGEVPLYSLMTQNSIYGPKLNCNYFIKINEQSIDIINPENCTVDTTLKPNSSLQLTGLELCSNQSNLIYAYKWIYWESDSATTIVVVNNKKVIGMATHLVVGGKKAEIEINNQIGDGISYQLKPGFKFQTKPIHKKGYCPPPKNLPESLSR